HRADVVAEGIPRAGNVGDGRRGQRLQRRITAQEFAVLRDDAVHLGLLEHDLRDQHVVGIARSSPGEVALVARVPSEQTLAEASPPLRVGGHASRACAGSPPWHGPDYSDRRGLAATAVRSGPPAAAISDGGIFSVDASDPTLPTRAARQIARYNARRSCQIDSRSTASTSASARVSPRSTVCSCRRTTGIPPPSTRRFGSERA